MLITKWAKAILSHPRDIIKGNYYRLINKNDLLYLSRNVKLVSTQKVSPLLEKFVENADALQNLN